MKKVMVILILLILISFPVSAFSVKDFLINFGDFFTGITGRDTAVMFNPSPICNEGETKCGTGPESSCVLSCQNEVWVGSSCCAYQCEEGECIPPPEDETTTVNFPTEDENPIISEDAICSDGTLYNACSINKPKFCNNGDLIDKCNPCECPTNQPTNQECRKNECIEVVEGEEDDDPTLINQPPIASQVRPKTTKEGETIQFIIDARDPEGDSLNYYFENNLNEILTEKVRCFLSRNNNVGCTGIKEGRETLNIIISDGINEVKTKINLRIVSKLKGLEKGITGGIANYPPVADAGPAITGFPGQEILLDAYLSYDQNYNLPSRDETFKWYKDDELIGTGITTQEKFPLGTHTIKLVVTDSEGEKGEDTVNVIIKKKEACKNTIARYFPTNTKCNNNWPSEDGRGITINSEENSCDLIGVCDPSLDYIIDEAIDCCTDQLTDLNKMKTCNFAKEYSNSFQDCKELYIIEGFGPDGAYMQKGYSGYEFCCFGIDILCEKTSYLYTLQSLPDNLKNQGYKCRNTPNNIEKGFWGSNTKPSLSHLSLADLPPHASINILESGSCVDFATAIVTLLKKAGTTYAVVVEADTHAFVIYRPPLHKMLRIIDMTGNHAGINLGGIPSGGFNYCEEIKFCYDESGEVSCPKNNQIEGCEGIKPKKVVARKTKEVGFEVTNIFSDIINAIKFEILR